jgi:hypothetical protein
VSALRSTAFFTTAPGKYGFRLESNGGNYPRDRLSWVTASDAFMPPDEPLANSLHRLVVSIENNEDGQDAVAIRALPHLADTEEDEVKPWFISSEVKGIGCRVYNPDTQSWENEWEDTNSVPSLLEITLYMEPVQEYEEPVKIQRLVEIPIAVGVSNAVNTTAAAGGTNTLAVTAPTQKTSDQAPAPARQTQDSNPRPGLDQRPSMRGGIGR